MRELTADLDPNYHPPRGMRVLGLVVEVYEKMSGFSGLNRRAITPVKREIEMVVGDTKMIADGVRGIRLDPVDGKPLPAWHPGAHLDLDLPSGRLRQYSLCGDPADRLHYNIAVRRIDEGGGGSLEVHSLRKGQQLTIHGPRNAFPYVGFDKYLFVAGGIGITPIRPMIYDAIQRGCDWQFIYTGRTRASMPFISEFEWLDKDRVHIWPDDEYGTPDGKKIISMAPEGAALYTCGPPPMIDAIRAEIPSEQIGTLHYERFSAPPVVGGEPFEVVLAASGHVVQVGAEESALAAIRKIKPDVTYSCQNGYCGTCPVRLIGGDVQHRDRCLSDEQRKNQIAICVSRGVDRITVDL